MLLWPDFSHENSFFFSSVFLKRREWGLSLQVDNCRYYDATYGREGEEGVMHPRERFYATFSLGKKRRKKIAFLLQQSHLEKKAVSHRLTSTPEKLPKHFSSQSIRPSPKWARAEAGRMWAEGGKDAQSWHVSQKESGDEKECRQKKKKKKEHLLRLSSSKK